MPARAASVRLSRVAVHLDGRPDPVLLREFVHDRSQPAFAELVRRYGPLVLGVCRRALNHSHDAEDAFQATFLVLARRANRISAPDKLPGWLHSVAVRTATEIRHMRDRRHTAHRSGDRCHHTLSGGTGLQTGGVEVAEQHELAAALDAELATLPDHYRLPVVLCELRGLSRKQAAAELGIAEGTLSSRLSKARKLLADRLTKRGFAASVVSVSAALAGSASARVPDSLAAAVALFTTTAIEVVPAVSLASDTVVKAMFATKLKSAVLAGGVLVALAGGLLLVPGGAGAQPGDGPGTRAKTDPAEPLVKQLGSKEFAEREAAEMELKKLGAKAAPALKVGLKSDVPEVVQRSGKLLAAIRKDDADQFVKAFLADKDFKEKFDHPVWTRWAKVIGDDRGSRELFAEVLGVDGAAVTLNLLAEAPDKANALYPAELERIHSLMKPRAPIDKGHRLSWELCYSMGEAAYVLYLGTFDGATSNRLEQQRWDHEPDPEVNALESLFSMEWMDRGAWVHKKSRDQKLANRPLVPAVHTLMAAQLMNLKNPLGVLKAFRHDWGEGFTRGKLDVCLPLARVVSRDDKLLERIKERKMPARVPAQFAKEADYLAQEVIVRSATWLYLAEAGEMEFLPDIAKHQADTTRVVQFWRTNENKREYQALVADVSIAAQLILHGKNPADYGFLSDKMQEKRKVYRNGDGYAFPDDESRKAAHEKALAFLKDAPKPEAKKDPEAERLVQQLGSSNFAEREAAEKQLKEMGAKSLPAVTTGRASDSPEVAERCERILGHIRVERLWAQFAKLVGSDKPARALFDRIRGSERGWKAVVAAADDPSRADELYAARTKELLRVGRGLPPVGVSGKLDVPAWPHMHAPPPVPAEDVAAWLYLGTFTTGTGPWTKSIHDDWRSETDTAWAFLPEEDHSSAQHMAKEYAAGSTAGSLKRLTVKWLEKRREKDALRAGLAMAMRADIPDALPVARSVLAKVKDETFDIHSNTAAAVALVGEFGTKDDIPLLLPHLADGRVHVGIITELPKGISGNEGFQISGLPGVKSMQCQVRDLAAVAVLKLSGRDPVASGFPAWPGRKHPTGSPKSPTLMAGIGFKTDAERTAAFEREKVLFKLAPVPQAKSVLPKKLDKMPDPSPELGAELFQFDEKYRGGTAEKFAELEKKADELANQFKEKDDQARIWYTVAHVAAQSDIRKHSERVRKYAPKCLETSRDPLHRAWMYSYLASTEEIADGAFADRRRKAADWLLTGYLELLAQDLPDEKPELPAVEKIGGIVGGAEEAQARARHAVQMAAREQVVFVRDQVFRRDVLVLQLRGLYKPNPNQSNRDEKGLDELKALAAKKLPDDAAVKVLMERVLK